MKKLLSRPLFWIVLIFGVLIAVSILSDPGAPQTRTTDFGPAPKVAAEAILDRTPNGFAELIVYAENQTGQDILSVAFYIVPRDAEGQELTDWTTRNRYSTGLSLKTGIRAEYAFQTIQEGIETMDVWICGCTFADDTRWGDPDCDPDLAMTQGIPVPVTIAPVTAPDLPIG